MHRIRSSGAPVALPPLPFAVVEAMPGLLLAVDDPPFSAAVPVKVLKTSIHQQKPEIFKASVEVQSHYACRSGSLQRYPGVNQLPRLHSICTAYTTIAW